jgi:hypothetical protein
MRNTAANLGTGGVAIADEIIVNWSSASAGAALPLTNMNGPFSQEVGAPNRWCYPTLDENQTSAAFSSQMKAILSSKSGITAGLFPFSGGSLDSAKHHIKLGLGLR